MRFIGSKAHLLSFIEEIVRRHCGSDIVSFGDLFCGTAVVSRRFKKLGYQVTANDSLTFCATFAKAVLLNNDEPMFSKLIESGEILYSRNYFTDEKALLGLRVRALGSSGC